MLVNLANMFFESDLQLKKDTFQAGLRALLKAPIIVFWKSWDYELRGVTPKPPMLHLDKVQDSDPQLVPVELKR